MNTTKPDHVGLPDHAGFTEELAAGPCGGCAACLALAATRAADELAQRRLRRARMGSLGTLLLVLATWCTLVATDQRLPAALAPLGVAAALTLNEVGRRGARAAWPLPEDLA